MPVSDVEATIDNNNGHTKYCVSVVYKLETIITKPVYFIALTMANSEKYLGVGDGQILNLVTSFVG